MEVAILVNVLFILLFLEMHSVTCRATSTGQISKGFSLELIHRDSPHSPLYDPTSTPADRIRRSVSRQQYLSDAWSGNLQSPVSFGMDYLTKMYVGTPPKEFWAIVDTGSDLVWTQCLPCKKCFRQDTPVFNNRLSATYKPLSCNNLFCTESFLNGTCDPNQHCHYSYGYADGSYTNGSLISDTLSFVDNTNSKRMVAIPEITIGCGHHNHMIFNDSKTAGVIGLGHHSYSLISQLGLAVDRKFSYCLTPNINETSRLSFGETAVFSGGARVQQTPLWKVLGIPAGVYFLTLNGVSVGGKRLQLPPGAFEMVQGVPGTIIDSGSTLTYLVMPAYNLTVSAVAESIKLPKTEPQFELDLCYRIENPSQMNKIIPDITLHFSGADWRVPASNSFFYKDGVTCLGMLPGNGVSIIGNMVQHNFHVEYDLGKRMLFFAETDCRK